jgi:hypothetical protein
MMGEVSEQKSGLLEEHRALNAAYKEMRSDNPDKQVYLMKMKRIEERLKADKFTKMFNEDMQRNPEIKESQPWTNKQFIEDLENKYRQQKRELELRQTEEGKEQIIEEN